MVGTKNVVKATKNVVKAMKKVGQGKVKEEGKVWFLQLRDNPSFG